MNKTAKEENHDFQKTLKFIIPSLLVFFLFMIPIPWNGSLTIPVAIFSKLIISLLGEYLPIISVVIISISAALAIISKIFKPKFIINNKYLNGLFNVSPLWFSLRIIGAILAIITIYKFRFDFIYSDSSDLASFFYVLNTYANSDDNKIPINNSNKAKIGFGTFNLANAIKKTFSKEKMKKTLSNKKNQPIIGRNNATISNSKNTSKPKTVKSSSKGKSSVDKTTKTKKNFINIKI